MPVAWYFVPYKRDPSAQYNATTGGSVLRYCAIDDQTHTLVGLEAWREIECLGNEAIVKVKGDIAALTTLNGLYQRIPKDALNSTLSDLTSAQKTALRNKVLSLGYTTAEVQAALGSDIGSRTLRDVLYFVCSKRRKPRYDIDTDAIVLDGVEVAQDSIKVEIADAVVV